MGAGENDYRLICNLIVLTRRESAERRGKTSAMIDFEARTITLPRERIKNGKEHVVPLAGAEIEILAGIERRDRDHVFGRTRLAGFSGWAKGNELKTQK